MIRKTDYVQTAAARLTSLFEKLPVTSGLVRGFAKGAQRCEDVLWQLFDVWQLETSYGDALEKLALIAGETRGGKTDAELLAALRVRVLSNRSRGTVTDLQRIIATVAPGARYSEAYPASAGVDVGYRPASVSRALLAALHRAKPAGVSVRLLAYAAPPAQTFAPGGVGVTIGLGPSHLSTGIPFSAIASVSEV